MILHSNAYFDEALYIIYWVLSEINHLIFIRAVFRLKTLAIYTDLNNDNVQQINRSIQLNNTLSWAYIIFRSLITLFQGLVHYRMLGDLQENRNLAIMFLYFNFTVAAIMIVVHIYLIYMTFQMQALLRRYNHITGRKGELLISISYFLFIGYIFRWFILWPIINYSHITYGYECSSFMKVLFAIVRYWSTLGWPFSYQAAFFALMW